jgi:subtilisin family serine protease
MRTLQKPRIDKGRYKTMRTAQSLAPLLTCFCLLAGPAAAAELTGAEIKDLISGKTIYTETTAASVTGTPGKGFVYYAADGTALYKTPSGALWHGTWAVKDNTTCTNWKENPSAGCSKWDKQGDAVSIINSTTGQVRAKVAKIAPGNPENLAP